jgi:hypothetical protein
MAAQLRDQVLEVPMKVVIVLRAGLIRPERNYLEKDFEIACAQQHVAGSANLRRLENGLRSQMGADCGESHLGECVREAVNADIVASVSTNGFDAFGLHGHSQLEAGPPADRLNISARPALSGEREHRGCAAESADRAARARADCPMQPGLPKESRQVGRSAPGNGLALFREVVRAIRVAEPRLPIDVAIPAINRGPDLSISRVHASESPATGIP